jgi:hypothetical protein
MLEIQAGQILTVTAGTWLVFPSGKRLTVAGKLIVEANTVFPAYFTSEDEAGWEGIHFQVSSSGSECVGCYIENVSPGNVALEVAAPISFREGRIRDVAGGTAISSTVPFTLSNVVIDYVGTGLQISGTPTATHTASHLTLTRCQQGVVNQGQTLIVENSILSTCGLAISTELSGTTAISYSLLHANGQDFFTEANAQLVQGSGIVTATPNFVDFGQNFHLQADSPAIDSADPQADYSREPGYNGGRANMGAYGNTREATQRPPLAQMAVALGANTTTLSGQAGETISYTVTLKNTGAVTDTYGVTIRDNHRGFQTSLFEAGYNGTRQFTLGPQGQITVTVWNEIRPSVPQMISDTFSVWAIGSYGVQDEIELTTLVSAFQESNGQVVLEAEHFGGNINRRGRSWLTQTILSDYTGSGYVSALPDTILNFTTGYTITSPELHYTINFTTTSIYTVWLRGYAPDAAGDSLYIALDEQTPMLLTGFAPQTWSWANRNPQDTSVTIEVTEPGLHTLHLWQREDGLRLDRILLTTDSSYNPIGNGPPENEVN